MKSALITGVAGQDGAYLSRLLLRRGYRVVGTVPDIPLPPGFVEAYLADIDLRTVDLTDRSAMGRLLAAERPEEIYNLASISSVGQSWNQPVEVAEVNGIALLGLLEEVRTLRSAEQYDPRICQASSAEIFGTPRELPQDESSPISPNNPYAVAKSFAHFSAANYREAYGMFVSNVILFNHESPLRPLSFVTRKITAGVAQISAGQSDVLELGRLDIRRDWGAATDYVNAMHLALAAEVADDFCIATGESHELGEFVELAFAAVGIADPHTYVRSNPDLFRPTDIAETRGNPAKAVAELGWRREMSFPDLVVGMVEADVRRIETGVEHDEELVGG